MSDHVIFCLKTCSGSSLPNFLICHQSSPTHLVPSSLLFCLLSTPSALRPRQRGCFMPVWLRSHDAAPSACASSPVLRTWQTFTHILRLSPVLLPLWIFSQPCIPAPHPTTPFHTLQIWPYNSTALHWPTAEGLLQSLNISHLFLSDSPRECPQYPSQHFAPCRCPISVCSLME